MKRFLKVSLRLFFAVLFLFFLVGVAAYFFPREALTVDNGTVKADALVVLGGGDGRAERAAELYKEGAAPRIIVTGYGDCAANVQMLEKKGVPADAITAEPRALTTYENVEFSLPLLRKLGASRVIIVTSWFHSRRALACFRHLAPDLVFFSRPSYIDYEPAHRNSSTYREHVGKEYAKLVGYWVAYGVCPL